MDAAGAGLILLAFAVLLTWRDLRGAWRRRHWRRAEARVTFLPGPAGPAWRFDITLADGRPVSVIRRDLRLLARNHGAEPVTVLHHPATPERGLDVPRRPGLGLVVGLGLAGLGIAALTR